MNEDTQIVTPEVDEEMLYVNALMDNEQKTLQLEQTVIMLNAIMENNIIATSGRLDNSSLLATINGLTEQVNILKDDWNHLNHVYGQIVDDNYDELVTRLAKEDAEKIAGPVKSNLTGV